MALVLLSALSSSGLAILVVSHIRSASNVQQVYLRSQDWTSAPPNP